MLFRSFGKKPHGEHLAAIQKSGNYKNGAFDNMEPTTMMREDISMAKISVAFFKKPKSVKPDFILPSQKSDLKNLPDVPSIVWFGHSSYLIKVDGKHILVDPVFSGHASPFSFSVKAFKGTNICSVDDLPFIDMLIITHDHYDHLDYKTVLKLKTKVKHIYTSLGVASHLRYWGIPNEQITELGWEDNVKTNDGFSLTATPARHFSGRGFTRAKTLWASYVLQTKEHKFFIGADSGYGKHFKEIGEKHGPFDIVMLECGQYNDWWPQIHMQPEETVQAAIDLNAKRLFPVHWAKFALAFHPWNESIERVTKKASEFGIPVVTPMLGQTLEIDKSFEKNFWWRNESQQLSSLQGR